MVGHDPSKILSRQGWTKYGDTPLVLVEMDAYSLIPTALSSAFCTISETVDPSGRLITMYVEPPAITV